MSVTVIDLGQVACWVNELDDGLVEDALGLAYSARDFRRAMREPKGRSFGAPQPRCPTCHVFKTQPNATCARCGFTPGQGYAG